MKIAIVGCGGIASAHLSAIRRHVENARIYLMDLDRAAAEALAANWTIAGFYTDLGRLLSEVQPDAAHILTPPPTHYRIAREALRAGCHVLIEKPVTETATEYQTLVDLARQERKVLCVDYSLLGMPVVRRALDEIASGRLGQLISVHCNFACSWPANKIPYGDPNHWAYRLEGGVLQNMVDHPLSLVLAAVNPAHQQSAFVAARNLLPNNCPDLLQVMVRNATQVGSFTLSLGHGNAERRAYFLLEGGSITIDLGRQLSYRYKGQGPPNFVKKTLSGLQEGVSLALGTVGNIANVMMGKLGRDPGIMRVVENFYNTIEDKEEPLITDELTLAVTRTLERIWQKNDIASLEDGKADHANGGASLVTVHGLINKTIAKFT